MYMIISKLQAHPTSAHARITNVVQGPNCETLPDEKTIQEWWLRIYYSYNENFKIYELV